MKKQNPLSRLFGDQRNYELPFFFFLTLMLVVMYIFALRDSPTLDSAWKIALFTFLMAFHIALYWVSAWFFGRRRWLGPYLVVQSLVAFGMGMMAQATAIIFGLYPGLIGLVIGLPVRRLWRILTVGYLMLLSLINYLLVTNLNTALQWAMWMVPVVLFVTLYVSMYLRQAEAREQAQALLADLKAANRQLSEYAAQVEDLTIANERQRMARELHDTLSQGLAGLILQLEAMDAHLSGGRPKRAGLILKETMEGSRLILADARRAIGDLRQPASLSLEDAARREAERFTAATGIPCELVISPPSALPDTVTEMAIRAIAEGLSNVVRHARAQQVRLSVLGQGSQELCIQLSDDGVGFDPASVSSGHYGLLGVRERVRLAGGSLEIHSANGKGTRLSIRIPLEEPADE